MILTVRGKRDDLPSAFLTEQTGGVNSGPGQALKFSASVTGFVPPDFLMPYEHQFVATICLAYCGLTIGYINILYARSTNVVPDAIRAKRKDLSDQENFQVGNWSPE